MEYIVLTIIRMYRGKGCHFQLRKVKEPLPDQRPGTVLHNVNADTVAQSLRVKRYKFR